ncbi:MAG: hypothetical protein JXO22_14225 [Phycisphaerae bacterium]|nr:hypothetical protein [Phycisphaerae bacterium]
MTGLREYGRARYVATLLVCGLVAMTFAATANGACSPPEVAALRASDMTDHNYYGCSVATSGNTAVVGAWGADALDTEFCGAAYVFVSDGLGGWSQQAKLTASDPALRDYFGLSVAIDGDTAIIGAYGTDDTEPNNPDCNSGSAYVFVRDALGHWTQQARLNASDATTGDYFGQMVTIDGDTALIGAWGDDDGGDRSGAAYVFVRDGGIWTQQAKLTASDATVFASFGIAVAIDGDTAIIGAIYDNDGVDIYGAAYAFTRDGSGTWSQQAKLTPSNFMAWTAYGIAVAIDGDTALVGAVDDRDGASSHGAAYAFTRDGDGTWSQQARLTAADAAHHDRFGSSVAIAGDRAVIGSPFDDDACLNDPNCDSGSAYVFTRSTAGTWTEQGKITDSNAAAGDQFADCVAIDGELTLIGTDGWARAYDLSDCESPLLGDCDCDGVADVFDIDAFVMAIIFPANYAATYPACDIMAADCNGDGNPDVFDIDAFVAAILP